MKAAYYFSIFTSICVGLLLAVGVFLIIKGTSPDSGISTDTLYPLLPFFFISILFAIGFKRRTKALLIINVVYFILPFVLVKLFPGYFSVDFLLLHLFIATIYLIIILVNYKKLT